MVCPLCRTVTKLSSNRVDDLLPNVTVNGLVDDHRARSGGGSAILEMRQRCTVCNLQVEAIAFCSTCDAYMCDQCCVGHKQLKLFFEGHEIVSIQDIVEGNSKPGYPSEKCSVHRQENKHIFCQNCKIRVCFKCVIIDHRDHKIQSHEDFEKEMQVKVSDLLHRCTAKQSELEKNIQTVETHRHEAHSALQLLREDVSQACHTKVKQLEDNRGVLVEKIDALERSFDEALNVVKSNDEQMIKSICSSVDLVGNARLGCLEADSLVAHTFLCEEIDGLLNEVIDQTSAATIREKAQKQIFKPADDTSLDLGDISETDVEAALDDMLKGASDDTSAATIGEEAHIAEEDITTGLSVPQSKSQPKVCVIKCVDLPEDFEAMTKYTNNSVAITYYYAHYINIFYSDENVRRKYSNIPHDMKCFDLVFQSDMTICVSTGKTKVHRYSPQGVRESTIKVTSNGHYLRLSRSQSDEILMTQSSNHVSIYDPSGNTLKHVVPTTDKIAHQVCATKSGLIVTSSFYRNQGDSPTMVAVYDRNGNSGRYLQSPHGVNLYPAVDEQDRVYVASVYRNTGQVLIRLYDIVGLRLNERGQFNTLRLTVDRTYFRMVSLTPHMLAFASINKLYFCKVVL
ncbi:tripartite motif-containing protein 45-like [Strongylocentrotus purpuratus]|uniref:B box-type domain-containing protein n=1 Tax=Strongylocentrotus purpuratus TaxID=7668 RepID=A0A7M7HIT6_STRPU|nr:tripartite motif-containing protein 45-like [Strongylocentrotus purpuratus]